MQKTANRLRELREAAGLSRTELAARAGIGAVQLARYERGESAIPDQRKLDLAEALGTSPARLMGWES